MKTIAVVRDGRISSLDHYKYFTNSRINFIAGNSTPHDPKKYNLPDNIQITNLSIYNPFLIDPAIFFLQKFNNLSWKYIRNLEPHIQNCDIVDISDTYYFWNFQAVKYAKKHDKPVVSTIWCNIPHHISTKIPPYSWHTQYIVKNVDYFILRNHKAINFTRSLGIPDSKTKVIYQGIDISKFTPNIKTRDTVTILYVGKLIKSKGILDILESFKQLSKTHTNIKLLVAGTGPDEDKVRILAQSLNIDYRGFLPYHQIPQLYQESDIFVAPSNSLKRFGIEFWAEYFSYVLMEAQAAGLPIVATNVGGIPEEIDKRNFLYPSGNISALTQALNTLINDSELRQSLGKINRLMAENKYNTKVQAQITENAILNLI